MNFRLKIFLIQFTFCSSFVSNDNILTGVSTHPAILPLAQVIKDIIDVYFVKEMSPLDIYVLLPFPDYKMSIFSEFLSNNSKTFSYKFWTLFTFKMKWPINIFNSAIFLIYNDDFLAEVLKFSAIRYQNQPIRYFIYINSVTFEKLKNSKYIKNFS
ncbi:hypothetical protein ACKWTF_013511 [Chironomus riparius]